MKISFILIKLTPYRRSGNNYHEDADKISKMWETRGKQRLRRVDFYFIQFKRCSLTHFISSRVGGITGSNQTSAREPFERHPNGDAHHPCRSLSARSLSLRALHPIFRVSTMGTARCRITVLSSQAPTCQMRKLGPEPAIFKPRGRHAAISSFL